jgi:TRASH domain-containing protein
MITGEYNLIVKLSVVEGQGQLEEFIRKRIAIIEGIKSLSYQIISRTVKDNQTIPLKDGIALRVKCDYCENEILQSGRVLAVGQSERFFCCGSCLTLYKQKYRGGIEAISK